MQIKGTIALVTGANRGIGKAFVKALIEKGAAKVYATARDKSKLKDVVSMDSGRVEPLALDITKLDQIAAAAKEAADVQLLINNAGVASGGTFLGVDDLSGARREMDTNYFGSLAMARAFAPGLADKGSGALVNIISIAGHVNFPIIASYSASKAAAHSLTQGLRAELKPKGVQVVGVYPGPVDTELAEPLPMEKAPPIEVVRRVLKEIEDGAEDVYPDSMAEEMHGQLSRNPKEVEKQNAALLSQG